MRKPKLTPTTNDQLQEMAAVQFTNGGAAPHIIPAHEPLCGEQFSMPVQPEVKLPAFPLPPPSKKKGRPKKLKEQTVNIPLTASAPEKKPLKIALIGTAPSSRMLAPYNDPSWTIWACSPGNMGNTLPRFDAWFEVHGTNLLWPENASFAENYINWMRNLKVPLYMQDQQLVANAITIPKDELVREFGPYYFTSSFSWMLAMALVAGASEIAMYGIDMASREEYIIQRPGAYYFLIRGAERGCKIWAPYESDIMQPPPLYGYSDVTAYGRKMNARKSELLARVNQMRAQRDTLVRDLTYLEGALEDNDYSLSIQGGAQDNADISYLQRLLKKATDVPALIQSGLTLRSQG